MIDSSQLVAYTGASLVGLLTLIKGISSVIRSLKGDSAAGGADRAATTQIDNLLRENAVLREENTQLKEDWHRLVKIEAESSAQIENLKDKVAELSMRINSMSHLMIHLIKTQDKSGIPPEVWKALIGIDPEMREAFDKE